MCPLNRIGATISAVACADLGKGLYELDFGAVPDRLASPPAAANAIRQEGDDRLR